jgi:hypothetical protein
MVGAGLILGAGLKTALGASGAAGAAKGGGLLGKIGGMTSKAGGSNPLGAAIGIGQSVAGLFQRKKADELIPSATSPEERSLLNYTKRMMNMRAGQAGNKNLLAQGAKQLGANYFKYGGRGSGALASYMANAQANLASQTAQQQAGMLQSVQSQTERLGDLTRDIGLLRSARKSAQAEGNVLAGNRNLFSNLNIGSNPSDESTQLPGKPKDYTKLNKVSLGNPLSKKV